MAFDFKQASRGDVVAALSVYVEPLVEGSRVAVLGDGELGLHTRLLELGARTIHLFDPDPERVARVTDHVPRGVAVRILRDDFDVRDNAFDLVVVPDVAALPDPSQVISRLRRVLDPRGAVVAMARARTGAADEDAFPELAPAAVEYAELYDLFALQFENVTMTGVLPFRGVVFAELGSGDDLAVSVDTRLVDPAPPGVFVVLASRDAEPVLDPYAIIQIDREESYDAASLVTAQVVVPRMPVVTDARATEDAHEAAAAYAAMHLKAEMLAQQLDDHRDRLLSGEQRSAELTELLADGQRALGILERRLLASEQAVLERDEQIAALDAELDQRSEVDESALLVDPALVASLIQRAEIAEAALLHVADAHAAETGAGEARLQERAAVVAEMEKELARREHLVRELVASLEEARDQTGVPLTFESVPVVPGVAPEEVARLRRKLDELALEVARRDGELTAQAWRITELETGATRSPPLPPSAPPPFPPADLERDLAAARDELDALRQALTQEHAARIAAEASHLEG